MTLPPPLDLALGVAALAAILTTLLGPNRRSATLGFLGLGVVLTLIWLRLGSLDVALAEAALGTGLLSAVLISLSVSAPEPGIVGPGRRLLPRVLRRAGGVLAGAALAVVMISVWARAGHVTPRWEPLLDQELPSTGVEHPVTAVLLGTRAVDTLLESAVLIVAGVIVLSLSRDGRPETAARGVGDGTGVPTTAAWAVRMLAAPLVLIGLWLLFAGSSGPGGAFQSGALLAATLVLLRTVGVQLEVLEQRLLVPALMAGVAVFVLAVSLGPAIGLPWADFGQRGVLGIVLTVEVLLTAGITAGLYLLYLGAAARRRPEAVRT